MKKLFLLSGIIFCGILLMSAQKNTNQKSGTDQANIKKTPILNAIELDNGTSSSKVTIHQDPRIDVQLSNYIKRVDLTMPYFGAGFRVQVFSSNNFKTAKNDASRIENQLRNAFPRHQVYVSYASPFWKVRIGNFRTSADAQKLRSDIMKLFPELSRDCYVVKDNNVKIN